MRRISKHSEFTRVGKEIKSLTEVTNCRVEMNGLSKGEVISYK